MKEIVLDTETTGLSVRDGHRIVEIGCIELENQIPTNKIFHEYLNPQRSVSDDARKVHGYSDEFLSNKKTFLEIAISNKVMACLQAWLVSSLTMEIVVFQIHSLSKFK